MRVSIEPMWWWSRISTISACSTPGTLWAASAWSTRITLRGRGETRSERVTSPTGCRRVDGDRRPVVDVLDLLGDVGDQVVEADRERLGVGHRPAGRARVTIRLETSRPCCRGC